MNLLSSTSEQKIKRELIRMRTYGLPATYTTVNIKGTTWYRLYIPGFVSRAAALKEAQRLRRKLHMQDIWVGK
ncbi:MAG: SPOR domain-containing protein [Zetaproteobacteria bacterium]|nr:MAG: SPOR domain-containing protein [Zetaproteobacteria bacterium]